MWTLLDVTFANPAAAATLGAAGDGLLGTDSCAITCAGSSELGHRCVLDFVRQTGTAVTRPNEEFVRVDGTRLPVEVTAAPRQGPGHRVRDGASATPQSAWR